MINVEVLKFGSSVLRSSKDLPVAVDEIYRRWRSGVRVLAIVSAFEGVTDRLIQESLDTMAGAPHAAAAYIAQGEQQTAAQLRDALTRCGIHTRLVEPCDIRLTAAGSPWESTPASVDVSALMRLWDDCPVLVLPGFYGVNAQGNTALFGRGGSDLSALFLAAELKATCRLLKDVSGVYDSDPASSKIAHRFQALSWETAVKVAGPLIQSKGLLHAQSRALPFYVGRPNAGSWTCVGTVNDEWETASRAKRPLRVALLGCGVVGRGVYEILKRYPGTFDIRSVVVADLQKHADIPERSSDTQTALHGSIDIVVECFGGMSGYPVIAAALSQGKRVVSANKALLAAHWPQLARFARASERHLWYSAAVGGVLPVLETLNALKAASKEIAAIRGIVNGTCGVVLEARAEGRSQQEAIELAQQQGFAEAEPSRDLSGQDSTDKLALMIEAAFGEWRAPSSIATQGIEGIDGDTTGYKLIARAQKTAKGIIACVAPELPAATSFLGQARGAENRIEIQLADGDIIRLRGQGAGRWPTAVSVMGDVHEVAREWAQSSAAESSG